MSTNATHERATRQDHDRSRPKPAHDPHHPRLRRSSEIGYSGPGSTRSWSCSGWARTSSEIRIDQWEARTGGNYRYASVQDGEEVAAFYGSFHEVRPSERLVQTFTWEGMPDGVSLETMTFEDLGDGRTRTIGLSVVENLEARDGIIASGMEVGVYEGYEKLDSLLAQS